MSVSNAQRSFLRKRKDDDDQESVRQKQLEEQVMDKKSFMRETFNRQESSLQLGLSLQSDKITRQYKDLLNNCQTRNQKLKQKLIHAEKVWNNKSIENIEDSQQSQLFLFGSSSKVSINEDVTINTLKKLKEQLYLTENAIVMENQLTESLNRMEHEVSKRKLVMERKVMELRRIHQVIRNTFSEHKKIRDKYIKDEQSVQELLQDTQEQILNLHNVEKAYTRIVLERGKARKKAIEGEENIIGHCQVRYEEAIKQNEQLIKQVDEITQQELQKRNRHKEFYYVGQYVILFEELERFSTQGYPDDVLSKYISINKISKQMGNSKGIFQEGYESQNDWRNKNKKRSSSSSPKTTTQRIEQIQQQQSQKIQIGLKDPKLQEDLLRDKKLNEIFNSTSHFEFDRLEIVQRLEKYYEKQPLGPKHMVEQIIELYASLQLKLNSLESIYHDKLIEQRDKKNMIEFLDQLSQDLKIKYNQVIDIEQNETFNKNLDNEAMSLDSGMILLNKEKSISHGSKRYLNIDQEKREDQKSNDDDFKGFITTVNKYKINGTNFTPQSTQEEHEFKINEYFIMNTYTYISELLTRICYSIIWLSEYTQAVPLDMDNRCVNVLKRLTNRDLPMWIPYNNQGNDQINPLDNIKNTFMSIFQQSNKQTEKKGSFVKIFQRKRTQKQQVNQSDTYKDITNQTYFSSQQALIKNKTQPPQTFVQQHRDDRKQQSLQQTNHKEDIIKSKSQPKNSNRDRVDSMLKIIHQSTSPQEDEGDDYKGNEPITEEITSTSTVNAVDMFIQRFPSFKNAQNEWIKLVHSDKVNIFFIRQEQINQILDQLCIKYDEKYISEHLHEAFFQTIVAGGLSLKETFEFIFYNYSEILSVVLEMSKITQQEVEDYYKDKTKDENLSKSLVIKSKQNQKYFIKETYKKIQQKMDNYLNSEDINQQPSKHEIARTKQQLAEDDQRYHLQFIEQSNKIQRKQTNLHEKLISKAIKDIDQKKKKEMEENFYMQVYGENQISDFEYIDTERRHLKHLLTKQQDQQKQINAIQTNKQISDACITRFFIDINNFETTYIKDLNKSTSMLHKLNQLELLQRDSKHLELKEDLINQQKLLTKRFQRETHKPTHNYEKPNKIYQLRQQISIQDIRSLKERKNRSLSQRVKTNKTSLPSITRIKPTTSVDVRVEDKNKSISERATFKTKFFSKKNFTKKVNFFDENTTGFISSLNDDSPYFDLQHEIMSHHLDLSLMNMERKFKQSTFLVGERQKTDEYGFQLKQMDQMKFL